MKLLNCIYLLKAVLHTTLDINYFFLDLLGCSFKVVIGEHTDELYLLSFTFSMSGSKQQIQFIYKPKAN